MAEHNEGEHGKEAPRLPGTAYPPPPFRVGSAPHHQGEGAGNKGGGVPHTAPHEQSHPPGVPLQREGTQRPPPGLHRLLRVAGMDSSGNSAPPQQHRGGQKRRLWVTEGTGSGHFNPCPNTRGENPTQQGWKGRQRPPLHPQREWGCGGAAEQQTIRRSQAGTWQRPAELMQTTQGWWWWWWW